MSCAEVIVMAARRPPTAPEDYEAMRDEMAQGFARLEGSVGEMRADLRNLDRKVEQIIKDRKEEAPAVAMAKGLRWVGVVFGGATLTGLASAGLAWALGWIGRK